MHAVSPLPLRCTRVAQHFARVLTPLYARSPQGTRAYGQVSRNHGSNIILVTALSVNGMGEAFILDGAVDARAFEIYVEQILAPGLQPGQTVAMDNLRAYQGRRVREAIEAKRCHLLYITAYSSGLSLIE